MPRVNQKAAREALERVPVVVAQWNGYRPGDVIKIHHGGGRFRFLSVELYPRGAVKHVNVIGGPGKSVSLRSFYPNRVKEAGHHEDDELYGGGPSTLLD